VDQQEFRVFYQLDGKESLDLEIHFVQLNLFKLFLFKNQKNLCQNNGAGFRSGNGCAIDDDRNADVEVSVLRGALSNCLVI